MEKPNAESLIQELRRVTTRLNHLSEYVKTINDQLQHAAASEQRLYAFIETFVDKVLQHHERKRSNDNRCLG